MIARHKQVVESVTTFEQSIEATQFLATLTLEGRDGLGDSATLLAQEIVRDAVTGEIVAVVALVSEEEVPPGEDSAAGRGERILFPRLAVSSAAPRKKALHGRGAASKARSGKPRAKT
jgi:hypothetical protein